MSYIHPSSSNIFGIGNICSLTVIAPLQSACKVMSQYVPRKVIYSC